MPKISPEKLEEMRSIGYLGGGLTRPKVREWRTAGGGRMKAVTDEAGNTVTQHPSGERQDVHIQATPARATALAAKLKG